MAKIDAAYPESGAQAGSRESLPVRRSAPDRPIAAAMPTQGECATGVAYLPRVIYCAALDPVHGHGFVAEPGHCPAESIWIRDSLSDQLPEVLHSHRRASGRIAPQWLMS